MLSCVGLACKYKYFLFFILQENFETMLFEGWQDKRGSRDKTVTEKGKKRSQKLSLKFLRKPHLNYSGIARKIPLSGCLFTRKTIWLNQQNFCWFSHKILLLNEQQNVWLIQENI